MTRTLEEIRKDDAACLTYSDGSIHCGEPGDNVAADRRRLMGLLDEAVRLIDEARCQPDDLHGTVDDQIAAFKLKLEAGASRRDGAGVSR